MSNEYENCKRFKEVTLAKQRERDGYTVEGKDARYWHAKYMVSKMKTQEQWNDEFDAKYGIEKLDDFIRDIQKDATDFTAKQLHEAKVILYHIADEMERAGYATLPAKAKKWLKENGPFHHTQ